MTATSTRVGSHGAVRTWPWAVREREAIVLADAFPCPTQLADPGQVRAPHLAELLAWATS